MANPTTQTAHRNWRAVALPTEHGGWSFISEPILLGLLLAPTWPGLALGVAAFAAFLLRQPLKLLLKDWRAGRAVPRTMTARRFVLLYGGVLLAAGALMLLALPTVEALLPLALALPLLGALLAADLRGQSRALGVELAGALAPGGIASALALIGGWALAPALGLWMALAAKAITAVLYVRARLRLERGEAVNGGLAVGAHAVALAILGAAVVWGLLPITAPVAMLVLLARAAVGLSALRKPRPPKIIGMQEIGYGLLFVLLIVLGVAFMPMQG